MNTVIITKDTTKPAHQTLYWLTERGSNAPYAFIQRKGRKWWLGGNAAQSGYFDNRKAAIAAAT